MRLHHENRPGGGARVCIVAPVHRYDDVRVFHKEAKTLALAGYEVHLLAQAEGDRTEQGVRVHALPPPASRSRRFLSHGGLLRRVMALDPRVVHLHNPETIPMGLWLKLAGKRVVYDTHEDFTRLVLTKPWIPGVLRRPLAWTTGKAEALGARCFDLALATEPQVARRLGRRAVIVENPPVADPDQRQQVIELGRQLDRGQELRLVFVGTVCEERGVLIMVEALEQINCVLPARLWLIGPQSDDRPLDRARHMPGWRHVDYLGRLPQEQAFAYVSRADLGLAMFLDRGGLSEVRLNKLFEYLLFGVPFVASDYPVWRGMLRGIEAGSFVEPNARQVAEEVVRLARDKGLCRRLGENGQRFVAGQYNWEAESRKLLQAYARLASPGREAA